MSRYRYPDKDEQFWNEYDLRSNLVSCYSICKRVWPVPVSISSSLSSDLKMKSEKAVMPTRVKFNAFQSFDDEKEASRRFWNIKISVNPKTSDKIYTWRSGQQRLTMPCRRIKALILVLEHLPTDLVCIVLEYAFDHIGLIEPPARRYLRSLVCRATTN